MQIDRARHRLRYFVADAWDEWRHSTGVNLLAVATLASSLFLAGLVLLVITNLDRHVQAMRAEVRVQVFLRDDIPPLARESLERELGGIEGVARVEHVDKQEALRRYRNWASGLAELTSELETNPLPASLELWLSPGIDPEPTAASVVVRLKDRPGIEEVRFDRETIRRLESLLATARLVGGGLALLVFVVVVLIMAGVTRLAVMARRTETEIMRLVGATDGFIRGPFLIAGLAQGLLASLAALLAVEGIRRAAWVYAPTASQPLFGLVASGALGARGAGWLLLVGISVSLAGAYFAVGKRVT